MKGTSISTDLGNVCIDQEVIAQVASSVAMESFGIVGMAAINMKDGIVKLLKNDYIARGVNVEIDNDGKLDVNFHVIVAYGVSIPTICNNLVESAKYKIESFTGLSVRNVTVYVEGVRVID